MGGLFTGAMLTKEGYRVTVLEKNATIGGGLQCFRRRGVIFESGMHILGGFMPGQTLHRICAYLGILDKLQYKHTDADAIDSVTCGIDGKTYRFPRGKERFSEYLAEQFPSQADNIHRYMDRLYALADEVDLFYLRRGTNSVFSHSEEFLMPADELIAKYITDARLQSLLAYMAPMYGGVAGHTPAFVHAVINVLYINGSSQFVDGSQQLADALAGIITGGGGRVLAADPVCQVAVRDRRVEYVLTAKGRKYTADWYISDLHPATLFKLTGDEAFPRSYRERVLSIPNSYSSFTVYVKLKPGMHPYVNHPQYFQKDYGRVWHLGEYDEASFPQAFMCITPPTKNQGEWAERLLINSVMPFDAVRQWENTTVGNRGADYAEWKQRHIQAVLDQMERLYPGFGQHIDFCFASSPLTIRDYYGAKEGTLYGHLFDCKDLLRSQLPIGTKVRNLLLTGQNVNLHGICGVPLTAIETTEALVGRGVVIDKINESEKFKGCSIN